MNEMRTAIAHQRTLWLKHFVDSFGWFIYLRMHTFIYCIRHRLKYIRMPPSNDIVAGLADLKVARFSILDGQLLSLGTFAGFMSSYLIRNQRPCLSHHAIRSL